MKTARGPLSYCCKCTAIAGGFQRKGPSAVAVPSLHYRSNGRERNNHA